MNIPMQERKHRQRLFDAVALLVVDLHRRGVFWGDCSLANILFKRDGQVLQAHLVDAETAEVHESLTRGQRAHDLEILEENIAGGLMDLAVRLEQPDDVVDQLLDEARGVAARYAELWDTLHASPTFPYRRGTRRSPRSAGSTTSASPSRRCAWCRSARAPRRCGSTPSWPTAASTPRSCSG